MIGFIQGQAINLHGWGVNVRSLTTTKQHKTIKAQQDRHPNMRGIPNRKLNLRAGNQTEKLPSYEM